MTGVLMRSGNLEAGMHTEYQVNMKAEAWVMHLQVKERKKLLANTRH